jgi:hypothetical protein
MVARRDVVYNREFLARCVVGISRLVEATETRYTGDTYR